MSTLYIVGTPIGNLEDITLRAKRTLSEVDFVLAEDTRMTARLLKHYEIDTPTISFHEHSKDGVYEKIFGLLLEGKSLALVTDAGMPGVSDPGSKLVTRLRDEVGSGNMPEVSVETIPGASALTAAISIAGLPSTEFYFAGFAPHKKGRETFFKGITDFLDNNEGAFVFFESPHRIVKALGSLKEFASTKEVVIAKELTKIHEEIIRGNAEELLEFFDQNPDKLKGEFVMIVI